jgi:hypothetical protein
VRARVERGRFHPASMRHFAAGSGYACWQPYPQRRFQFKFPDKKKRIAPKWARAGRMGV